MFAARPLPGLPPYGPAARSFPKPNAFREGFVVEFFGHDEESWIGNFATSWVSGQRGIYSEQGPECVVVVADGAGYIVDANEKQLVRVMASNIQYISFVAKLKCMIVSNGLWFEAFNAHQLIWQSRRVSWNRIRHVSCSDSAITGEADDPTSGSRWLPFRLDLSSGEVEGGSYDGPAMDWHRQAMRNPESDH
jgi:hypothetical protein